jgi:RNA polymerase sigma factor (TIGR02999 family)
MRRILLDHARARGRQKRGGDREGRRVPLSVADLATAEDSDQIVTLDDALRRLSNQDARMAQIVQLRFYAGLTIDETAKAMGVSPRTVKRDWEFARAWLFEAVDDDGSSGSD